MELSLQSKMNLKVVFEKRENMINNEKLHINEKMDYQKFLELYKKYGGELTEKEFAKYFLDIDTKKLYALQAEKIKEVCILNREYVSDEEINEIRNNVISYYELKEGDKIDYKTFEQMYSKFSGKLSIDQFAEEVLDMAHNFVSSIKAFETKKACVLKAKKINKQIINEIVKKIISENNVHIGTPMKYEEIQELYKKYGNGLTEKEFAIYVLMLKSNIYNAVKSGRSNYAYVFPNYIVNPKSIYELREKVILEEGLHIEDAISYKKFQELYQKYGGMLSEEMFAEEILDISAIGVDNMKKR